MKNMQSAERVSAQDISDNYVFQRSLLAYHEAARIISGKVMEIGTGSGYGVSVISPKAKAFFTVDRKYPPIDVSGYHNVEFNIMKAPPIAGVPDSTFDFVIMFQVIEHVKDDFGLLKEIRRVLRPGGKMIVTTPNKLMSLTRNPWHVREYTPAEFTNLMGFFFSQVEAMGVFGNGNVKVYYEKNRQSVEKMARYDILNLRKWMPRLLLRIPYDILNRINRRKLLEQNMELTSQISMQDYSLGPVADDCFDLFYICTK